MKKLKNLGKRGLSLLIVLVMCLGMLQLTAFATGENEVEEVSISDVAGGIVEGAAKAGSDAYKPESDHLDENYQGADEDAAHDALGSYLEEAFNDKAGEFNGKIDEDAGAAIENPKGFENAADAAAQSEQAKNDASDYLLEEDDEGNLSSEETKAVDKAFDDLAKLGQTREDIAGDMSEFDSDVSDLLQDYDQNVGDNTEALNEFLEKTYEDVDASLQNANDTLTALQDKLEGVDGMTEAERDALREELQIDDLQKQVSASAASVAAAEQGVQDAQARVTELQKYLDELNELLGAEGDDVQSAIKGRYATIDEALTEWNRIVGELRLANSNLETAKAALETAQGIQEAAQSYLKAIEDVLTGLTLDENQSVRDVVAKELERLIDDLEAAITHEAKAKLVDDLKAKLAEQKKNVLDGYDTLTGNAQGAWNDIQNAKSELAKSDALSEVDKDAFDKAAGYLENAGKKSEWESTVNNLKDAMQNAVPGVKISEASLSRLADLVGYYTEEMSLEDKRQAVWRVLYDNWDQFGIGSVDGIIEAIVAAQAAQANLDEFNSKYTSADLSVVRQIQDMLSKSKSEDGTPLTLEQLKAAYADRATYERQLSEAIGKWNGFLEGYADYLIDKDKALDETLWDRLSAQLGIEKTAAGNKFDEQIAAENEWLGECATSVETAAAALSRYLGADGVKDIQDLLEAEAALRATTEKGEGLNIDKKGILSAALAEVDAQIKKAEAAQKAVNDAWNAVDKAQKAVDDAQLALEELENSVDKDNLDKAQKLQEQLAAAQANLAKKITEYNNAVENQASANAALEGAVTLLNNIQIIADAQQVAGGGSTGPDPSGYYYGGGDDNDAPSNTPNNPVTDVPAVNAPETDVPAVNAPETDVPAVNAPETDVPAVNAPETDVPAVDAPGADVPAVNAPEADVPGAVLPDTDGTLTDIPDAGVPLANAPAVNAPETDAAGEEETLMDIAGGEVPLAGFTSEEVSTSSISLLWLLALIPVVGAAAALVLKTKKRED